jgi:hypothetical protein
VSPMGSRLTEYVPMVSERFCTAPGYRPFPACGVALSYWKVPDTEDVNGSVDLKGLFTSLTLPVNEYVTNAAYAAFPDRRREHRAIVDRISPLLDDCFFIRIKRTPWYRWYICTAQ